MPIDFFFDVLSSKLLYYSVFFIKLDCIGSYGSTSYVEFLLLVECLMIFFFFFFFVVNTNMKICSADIEIFCLGVFVWI